MPAGSVLHLRRHQERDCLDIKDAEDLRAAQSAEIAIEEEGIL